MNKSRVILLVIVFIMLFSGITYRIADIQLFSSEDFGKEKVNLLKESVIQRTDRMVVSDGRGIFIDKDGQLIGKSIVNDVVLFPFLEKQDLPEQITDMFSISEDKWETFQEHGEPVYLSSLIDEEIDQKTTLSISGLQVPGFIPIEREKKESKSSLQHLIGITRESDGNNQEETALSGLEKAFDPFLSENKERAIQYHVDALGNPLMGLNVRYHGNEDGFYPLKLQTTIDKKVQNLAEDAASDHGLSQGGIVVIDVKTREVAAMISKPEINQEDPYYNDSIKNQNLIAHFPGSIFKLVTAAAVLERAPSLTRQEFDCSKNLYNDGPSERDLGVLNFNESFSQSCNLTFAMIAEQLLSKNPSILEQYAEKLGLVGPVGWKGRVFQYDDFRQFPEEESGTVWGNNEDKSVSKAIAQTAIGQKEVKITPLAVANMMATIANNGIKREVRAVSHILYQNGTSMYSFEEQNLGGQKIKPETALQLRSLLADVVENGTGSQLGGLNVAGKSGTAETGRDGLVHHWFAGYFPADKPKYAMVVVNLDHSNPAPITFGIYKQIVKNIGQG
ncbi:peptidoglycan D,D-transpeptidase FtsI family protein [Sediminibacillus massiliensis]|uniref:peptidoglycan D,D-transpeptidase FtsI family protein n=1 Tax=Sediminibacillus massiliensis TaxID=1926277 RepID=UPI0015C2E656|nr:penicillin-binding transpeptidase domain-containing protein [Sediminibacillus massiliensis]